MTILVIVVRSRNNKFLQRVELEQQWQFQQQQSQQQQLSLVCGGFGFLVYYPFLLLSHGTIRSF